MHGVSFINLVNPTTLSSSTCFPYRDRKYPRASSIVKEVHKSASSHPKPNTPDPVSE